MLSLRKDGNAGRTTKDNDTVTSTAKIISEIRSRDIIFERKLGYGASSEVYLATWKTIHVAIKEVSEDWQDIFEQEKKMMGYISTLKNASLYTVNCYGFIGKNFNSLVLEYMPHGDLLDFINSKYYFHPSQLFANTLDVTYAIKFLHDNDILHCDIKPDNIMLDANWKAKLGDFGFALTKNDANDFDHICGTEPYLAPEIIEEDEPHYSTKSDMYAYAKTVYASYTFKEKRVTANEIKNNIKPPYPGCPTGIVNIIKLGLMAQPEKRLSADQAVEILEDMQNQVGGFKRIT